MNADKIIVDGCELTRDERERSVTYKGTHGDVEFVVVQTIWKTWRAIATVLPRSARLRMEREADTQERATEQLTAIVNDVRTALATPPLAPCEPSAEEVRPELDRLRAENRRLQDALNAGVEHVCRSFMKWRDALEANPTNGCAASVSTLDTVFLAIRKSSMLARLVYGCEPLRTVKCPAHKGKWSGLEGMDNVCPHGCQLTGWLPANDDALSRASAPPAKGDGAK